MNHSKVGGFSDIRSALRGEFKHSSLEGFEHIVPGFIKLGRLGCPRARSLISLNLLVEAEIGKKAEEYEQLCENRMIDPAVGFRDFSIINQNLSARRNIIMQLFFRRCYDLFPEARFYERLVLCKGWVLAGDSVLKEKPVELDVEHPVRGLFDNICNSLDGVGINNLPEVEKQLKPVDMKNEEFGLGTVSSLEVRCLYHLHFKLCQELDKLVQSVSTRPAKSLVRGSESLPELSRRLREDFSNLKRGIEMTKGLFWIGVEEEIPATRDPCKFNLRQNWVVVKVPPTEEESKARAQAEEAFKGLMGMFGFSPEG